MLIVFCKNLLGGQDMKHLSFLTNFLLIVFCLESWSFIFQPNQAFYCTYTHDPTPEIAVKNKSINLKKMLLEQELEGEDKNLWFGARYEDKVLSVVYREVLNPEVTVYRVYRFDMLTQELIKSIVYEASMEVYERIIKARKESSGIKQDSFNAESFQYILELPEEGNIRYGFDADTIWKCEPE